MKENLLCPFKWMLMNYISIMRYFDFYLNKYCNVLCYQYLQYGRNYTLCYYLNFKNLFFKYFRSLEVIVTLHKQNIQFF